MGVIISFFNIVAIVIILVAAAFNMRLLIFLETFAFPISVIFWGALLFLAYRVGKSERTEADRYTTYCFPFAFLPAYTLLFSSLGELTSTSGFEILLLPIMVFLCMSFALGIGLAAWCLCAKVKDILAVPLTIVAEIIVSAWISSIGM